MGAASKLAKACSMGLPSSLSTTRCTLLNGDAGVADCSCESTRANASLCASGTMPST